MKLDAKDFKRLQWAIALLVFLALIGGASLWSVLLLQKSGEQDFKSATGAQREIRSKLAQARDEEQELREKIGRFQALSARGYIGSEQRLDWVETIARIKAARRMSKLDYEFAPQRPVDASILPGGASAGGFEFVSSQMKLRAHLLHEGELLGFLAELRDSVRALVQVRSCSLAPIDDRTIRGNNAQLKADCTLEWITLKESK
ncbi:MAG: hypothetical protein K9K30_10450 [Burkholderiaceae bacterium]|nr:hypothetical protein [Sulfuritalea sp.]MCF8175649.1 hypothetical protein [Burkholderiaceae bacterium]